MHRLITTFLLAAFAAATQAQTVTVTTLNDISDAGVTLPGPDGRVSFREAVEYVNNTPGPQTIEFAIPESEFWLVDDAALLRLEDGPWSLTDDGTTLDFASQATNIGDTNPNGMEVGVYGLEPNGWGFAAIFIYANDCTVKGMGDVYQRAGSVSIFGSNNKVIGCVTDGVEIDQGWQGPPASFNVIGGTEPGESNTLGFVQISSWADDNVVVGNEIKTVSVVGSRYSTYPKRNRIGGPTVQERNVIKGFGGFSGEGFPTGHGIKVDYAEDTLIEGNYIGVNADGMSTPTQRGPSGIDVRDSINTTIKNNLIAGIRVVGVNHASGLIFGTGIRVNAVNQDNLGTTIVGNIIGADATGQSGIVTRQGITVAPSTGLYYPLDTVIGGPNPEDANIIAFTETMGIKVHAIASGVRMMGNSIFANDGLGIDLQSNTGVSEPNPNDEGDIDGWGNGLQNFPVLDAAESDLSSTRVTGTLSSMQNRAYTLEFFASPECDPSGYGEGQLFLGRTGVITDASGTASFDELFATPTPAGWVVTATATEDSTGNTSEFSLCLGVSTNQCPADLTGDGYLDFFDVSAFLSAYNSVDPAADFTGDGLYDFFDVSAFLGAYNAGCP